MAETALQAQQRFQNKAKATVMTYGATLAQYGIPVEDFSLVMCEALISNPDILDCTEESIGKAIRAACIEGLVPNGQEAAITSYRDNRSGKKIAQYMPMKEGLSRLWYETVGSRLYTGLIFDTDKVEVQQGAGIQPYIKVTRDPFQEKDGAIIGCWLWTHIPGEPYASMVLWRRVDIERRKAMSKTTKDSSPWVRWYGEKALTSIQKHFIGSQKHRITSGRRAAQLQSMIAFNEEQEQLPEGQATAALPAHWEVFETTATEVEAQPTQAPQPAQPQPQPTQAATEQPSQAAGEDDIPENVNPPAAEQQQSFLPKEKEAATATASDPTAL